MSGYIRFASTFESLLNDINKIYVGLFILLGEPYDSNYFLSKDDLKFLEMKKIFYQSFLSVPELRDDFSMRIDLIPRN